MNKLLYLLFAFALVFLITPTVSAQGGEESILNEEEAVPAGETETVPGEDINEEAPVEEDVIPPGETEVIFVDEEPNDVVVVGGGDDQGDGETGVIVEGEFGESGEDNIGDNGGDGVIVDVPALSGSLLSITTSLCLSIFAAYVMA